MTDLERAQAVLAEVSRASSPVKAMMAILATARREGEDALADARAERDAYMRSYEDACAERDRARREGAAQARKQAEAVMEAFAHRMKQTGAEEMRERAADRDLILACLRRMHKSGESYEMCARWISEAIRALPLTPEEPCRHDVATPIKPPPYGCLFYICGEPDCDGTFAGPTQHCRKCGQHIPLTPEEPA